MLYNWSPSRPSRPLQHKQSLRASRTLSKSMVPSLPTKTISLPTGVSLVGSVSKGFVRRPARWKLMYLGTPLTQMRPFARRTPAGGSSAQRSNLIMSKGFAALYAKVEKREWCPLWSCGWAGAGTLDMPAGSKRRLFLGGASRQCTPQSAVRSAPARTVGKMAGGGRKPCSSHNDRSFRSVLSADAASARRSTLLSSTTSACASCRLASALPPSSVSPSVVASTTQMTASRCTWSMSSTCCSVVSTGSGSQTPEVSIMTTSMLSRRAPRSLDSCTARSSLISQHTQPLVRVITRSSSTRLRTNAPSTSMLPYSLMKTAALRPWLLAKMWFTSVVFPAPKKPVIRQMGIPGRTEPRRASSGKGSFVTPCAPPGSGALIATKLQCSKDASREISA
mmetsp:Transcript_36368/g.100181  ORF Transcript_36368/g.100181 Transcript_36368/m.100181 type:complete len:393 (+) Transcript_36368:130-1308(+)